MIMNAPFVYITTHQVPRAVLPELDGLLAEYQALMEAREPGLMAHHAYLGCARPDGDGAELTLVQIHRDAASAEQHMKVSGGLIAKGTALLHTVRVQVYGAPGPIVAQALERNADLGAEVIVAEQPQLTFTRSEPVG
jgi:hypothetical protein